MCAAFPVNRDTRDGQHRATVQKCFLNHVPSCLKCFWTEGWYSIESRCRSWSSVMMKMKFGLVVFAEVGMGLGIWFWRTCWEEEATTAAPADASSRAWLSVMLRG